jgi:hypothetical protein
MFRKSTVTQDNTISHNVAIADANVFQSIATILIFFCGLKLENTEIGLAPET